MFDSTSSSYGSEMQVVGLRDDNEFMARQIHPREPGLELSGMRRLANVFAERPEKIFQELVDVAQEICGADSAGVTLEEAAEDGNRQFRWIATAGEYKGFLDAVLPRFYSPCGTCLERGQPQLFRVPKAYLDVIGVDAPPVTDGILIPWQVDETRGTVWILAHGPYQQFDREDYRMMRSLSDFAAIAIRHRLQQELLLRQASSAAAAALANDLAHQINNPLQSVTNLLFLAAEGEHNGDAKSLAQALSDPVQRLTMLVGELLTLPAPQK